MSDSRDIQLLEKFLAGTATPDEEVWLRDWAETTLSRPGTLDLLRAAWEQKTTSSELMDREQRWNALRQKIVTSPRLPTDELSPVRDPQIRSTSVSKLFWRRPIPIMLRAASVMALFVGAAWFVVDRSIQRDVAIQEHSNARSYVTGRGQRAIVQLPDGTTTTLAPETQLRFLMSDATGARRIELTGEAFFSVEPNSGTPFVVHAGNTITKVLGTGFGVRRYGNDSTVRVAVSSGRVSVQTVELAAQPSISVPLERPRSQPSSVSNTKNVILSANEVVRVASNGNMRTEREADLSTYLGWRSGLHVFRMVPAATVAAELGRAYDLDIRFDDPRLAQQLLTLSFATDRESVMLDILASTMLDVRIEREGRTATISRVTR